jgi:hypothetical protein
MSPKKLKGQILSEHGHANNVYIRLTINGNLAGNVFGTRWIYQGHPVLWITQLCVHTSYRNRGIAKQLLGTLYQGEHCVGILSSHPFAICAALRIFGSGVEIVKPDLEMTRNEVKGVMESCPVGYVKDSKLHGTLWNAGIEDEVVSCADTGFWVDHEEPRWALRIIGERGVVWPLGQLPDGHEFLVLVNAKTSERSRIDG